MIKTLTPQTLDALKAEISAVFDKHDCNDERAIAVMLGFAAAVHVYHDMTPEAFVDTARHALRTVAGGFPLRNVPSRPEIDFALGAYGNPWAMENDSGEYRVFKYLADLSGLTEDMVGIKSAGMPTHDERCTFAHKLREISERRGFTTPALDKVALFLENEPFFRAPQIDA